MSKILYPNSEGGISVIHPTGELPIEDVCQKDVPAGTPYLIPSDRSVRNAWEADFSNPDGHGIGADAWFAAKAAAEEAAEAERLAAEEAAAEQTEEVSE
jgi:hypothetical protein